MTNADIELDKEIAKWEERFCFYLRKPFKTPEDKEQQEFASEMLGKALDKKQAPLLFDLLKVGISVNSVWDLVNTSELYPEAIPVLVKHLQLAYPHRIQQGIVRALTVKEAKGIACRAVIDAYRRIPSEDDHYKWAFGNAFTAIISAEYVDEVIEIVLDESNGQSRHMFVVAMRKFKSQKVKDALIKLSTDKVEAVRKEALKGLSLARFK